MLVLTAACSRPARIQSDTPGASGGDAAGARALLDLQQRIKVPNLDQRRFSYRELWAALDPVTSPGSPVRAEEIGRSGEGRALRMVSFGSGPVNVLLWSQMHGDESTATMSLADLFTWFATSPGDPRVERLARQLTVYAIPMLNPDGAERFQRRNAYGIDINRDARALSTPEAQALRGVQQRLQPDFGFNLHDQNVRTRVGGSERLAAIALLAPPPDDSGRGSPGFRRAEHLAATIRRAIEPLVGGHIARYDDTFNPRAFGDLMQSWGTSTVLIESGGWAKDPEKQHLRSVNFVGLVAALEAIASGDYARTDPDLYRTLPPNGRSATDLLITGGTLVVPGLEPIRADIAVEYDQPLLERGGEIAEIGDLRESVARDTLDASGLFVHFAAPPATTAGTLPLEAGSPATFVIRRGAAVESDAVWRVGDGGPCRLESGSDSCR